MSSRRHPGLEPDPDDTMMRTWYASVMLLEVDCMSDQLTMYFENTVWVEQVRAADEEGEEPLPVVRPEGAGHVVHRRIGGEGGVWCELHV